MPVSTALAAFIENKLGLKIFNTSPVSGGSINKVYCLQTEKGKFLIKINSKSACPGMFRLESEGLNAIRQTATVAVPNVLLTDDFEDESFLILEWIDNIRPTPAAMQLLGLQLSELHRHTSTTFGLPYANYMGSLTQSNHPYTTWAEFYITERLIPQVSIARSSGLIGRKEVKDFDQLYRHIPGLFTEETPSLIHGDLWSGNFLMNEQGIPYLIDPAICYGNREFDIAMTTLFGGFTVDFHEVYNNNHPLQKGWEQRIDLWNIYPLLIHLNIFGGSYLHKVLGNLKKYL